MPNTTYTQHNKSVLPNKSQKITPQSIFWLSGYDDVSRLPLKSLVVAKKPVAFSSGEKISSLTVCALTITKRTIRAVNSESTNNDVLIPDNSLKLAPNDVNITSSGNNISLSLKKISVHAQTITWKVTQQVYLPDVQSLEITKFAPDAKLSDNQRFRLTAQALEIIARAPIFVNNSKWVTLPAPKALNINKIVPNATCNFNACVIQMNLSPLLCLLSSGRVKAENRCFPWAQFRSCPMLQ